MRIKWSRDGTVASLVSTSLNQLVVCGYMHSENLIALQILRTQKTRAERSRSPDGDRGSGFLGRSQPYSSYKDKWQMLQLDRLKGAIAFLNWTFAPLVSTSLNQLEVVGGNSLENAIADKKTREQTMIQMRAERSRSPDVAGTQGALGRSHFRMLWI